MVHFRKADVLHAGDVFFNGNYPYIDVDAGGSLSGLIAAVERILELAGAETRILPGHGPRAKADDLRAYREMLVAARHRIAPLVESGKSVEEVIAAKPMADFDGKWGKGFIKPDNFLREVHISLAREKAGAR